MRKNILKALALLSFTGILFTGVNAHAINENKSIELKTKAESLAVLFDKESGFDSTSDYSASYKLDNGSYTEIDSELIRIVDGKVRIDAVGLKAGNYSLEIKANNNVIYNLTDINIKADDRSGYAHFNNTTGVGAYNNDGTLKDNAVVVYVNDSNKNTVTAKIGSSTYTGLSNIIKNAKFDNIPVDVRIIGTIVTKTWNKIEYKSNSNGSYNVGNTVVTRLGDKLYNLDIKNGDNVSLSTLGKDIFDDNLISNGYNTLETNYVKLDGLTSKITYGGEKTKNGNTVNDFDSYFNMLEIDGAKNVTVEGIGEDAMIFQWGFTWKRSNSIEVKNLTFKDYPEDACAFQGKDTKISSKSVESFEISGITNNTVWVHNNTFLQGKNTWDVTYEQDKHEGDGAVDVKFYKNVTYSYNHFVSNHKTGLVGGSEDNITANITYHHNWYESCQSRMPYARQANIHMYNNYYDSSTGTTMQIYAGCYAFIENCYFKNDNKVYELNNKEYKDPAVKAYNNIFDGSKTIPSQVSNRTDSVSNGNILVDVYNSFQTFDTNSNIFYYDSTNNCSNVSIMNDVNDIPLLLPTVSGAGNYQNSSFNSIEEDGNLSEIDLGYQFGNYVKNNNTYKAIRFVGKFKYGENINSSNIDSIRIEFKIYNKSNELFKTINKDIDSVYDIIKSGDVVVAPQEVNVKYYYAIINGITDKFDGYKIVATAYININSKTLTSSETCTI